MKKNSNYRSKTEEIPFTKLIIYPNGWMMTSNSGKDSYKKRMEQGRKKQIRDSLIIEAVVPYKAGPDK
jgi:hypothetical protein